VRTILEGEPGKRTGVVSKTTGTSRSLGCKSARPLPNQTEGKSFKVMTLVGNQLVLIGKHVEHVHCLPPIQYREFGEYTVRGTALFAKQMEPSRV